MTQNYTYSLIDVLQQYKVCQVFLHAPARQGEELIVQEGKLAITYKILKIQHYTLKSIDTIRPMDYLIRETRLYAEKIKVEEV